MQPFKKESSSNAFKKRRMWPAGLQNRAMHCRREIGATRRPPALRNSTRYLHRHGGWHREENMTWFIGNMTWSNAVAFLSALFWLAAAAVRTPKTVWSVMGDESGRPRSELDATLRRLQLQSYLNAAAVFFMAVSAFLRVATL